MKSRHRQWSKVNFSSLIFSICILLCSPEVSGQNIVFIEIEEEADFPGGSTEMGKFINDNIDYPQEAIDLGIKGRVTVRFVVEETGQVSNVSVTIPLAGCKACDRAAVKVVEKMPAWIPAKIGGAAVGSWVTLPIKFEVQDESSKKSNHQGSGSSTINNGPAQEDMPPPPMIEDGEITSTDETFDFQPYLNDHDDIQTFIEEEADFPGGAGEMAKFINDNIDYPQEAIDLGIKGRVTVRFVVEETGQVSNVSVTIPLAGCKACDRAAVKVVEKMPAWIPAKIGGAAVGSWVTLPIKFEVQDESSKKSNHQGSGSSTINNGPAQEDNYTFLKACSYNYNEIPLGVQLVNSQEEWNNLSPYNACCCYPEFNASNKSLGLLYNYKAYEKISNRLKANSNGPLVITKEGWQDIFSKISADRNNIVALALNCYPGYFDEAWYTASEQFVGFWLDEQSMVSFSHNNYGEPMLDENIIGDRQNLVALSIRLNKGQQVSCEEDKWMVEPYIARGNNKSIKLITNSRDWDKYCSKEPCCCFLNFDYNNDQYGLLYNGLAMIQLKYDSELQKQGYRIATKADMDKLIGCRLKSGTFFDLFNCENDAINRFHISPNGYFGLDGWHAPEEGKTRYRLLDDDNSNLMYEFDCASKTYVQKMGKWGDAYAVKFIKR